MLFSSFSEGAETLSPPITGNNSGHNYTLMIDKYVRYLFIACAVFMTVAIISIIGFVGNRGLETFKAVSASEFFLSAKWNPNLHQ